MTMFHYDRPRLGVYSNNRKVSRLKEQDIALNADNLCIVISPDKSLGKRRIINDYSVRALSDEIDREITHPTSGISSAARYKKKRKAAHATVAARHPGLTLADMDLVERIAEEFYDNSERYKRRRRGEIREGRVLNVIVDECVSPYLVDHFSTSSTRAFHVSSVGLKSRPDKEILLKDGIDIIVTEDRDFVDLVSAAYLERVKRTGRTGADTSDLPMVVYIEHPARKNKAPSYSRDETLERECKGVRRGNVRDKRVSQGFNQNAVDYVQIKSFPRHLPEILRRFEDPLRPVLALTIKPNGRISATKKHDIIDGGFRFVPKDLARLSREPILIDGQPRIPHDKVGSRRVADVFKKARMGGQDRATLIEGHGINTDRRFGRQGPYRRHGSRQMHRA